jgi:two-component system chemotaxis sensor kinase CheA
MNEVLREFLIETHEGLAQLDLDLVALEKDPRERQTLARVFRTLHTVKGSAGFLGLQRLLGLAHAAENLLGWLRDGKIEFTEEVASALLRAVDAIRQMLQHVEANETDGDGDYSELIGNLEGFRAEATGRPAPARLAPAATAVAPSASAESASLHVRSAPEATIVTQGPPPPEPAETRAAAVADTSIRVDVGLLDKLMTLVGELVLARNQILQVGGAQENAAQAGAVQRLNLLTTELQAGVMKTRMQPIGNIWSKFPRVVRDLAVACGKQAYLEMEGRDTELDKSIVEAVRDPLTHLVRNAVDHGIEPPAERLARGKPAEGRVALRAFHEGGKVIIEIADDGGGIDPQRVRAKALNAKLLTPEQADRLSDREVLDLIFLPGFSTADRVTQFSGRGVGMDVVRTNVEKIGGSVTIDSKPGAGTTVRMKIPLTLAIIPALTVTCDGDRYAIPQVSLLELVHLGGEQAGGRIELISDSPVYRLRGNLLPIVYLRRQLGLDRALASNGSGGPGEVDVVVLQADDRQFGLVVDAIHDTEEIVVKPLQKQLKGAGVYAGATIMGDGKVALILDVLALARGARVVSEVRDRVVTDKQASVAERAADRQAVLLFGLPDGSRMAVALTLVARLEEFPRAALERAGARFVVQYRGEILPLIDVARSLRRRPRNGANGAARRDGASFEAGGSGPVQVVVCAAGDGRHVGLVVDRILDVTEEAIVARSAAHRRGVLFTAVVQERVTEFLDVDALVRSELGDPAGQPRGVAAGV